jgi:uncharacterized protein (DUF433 family)
MKSEEYVSQQEGAYRVGGTRVSLDSIVYAFLEGQTPETIIQWFPVLSLEQVYGAITYYLAHRSEIDAYLREGELEAERLREKPAGQIRRSTRSSPARDSASRDGPLPSGR